MRDHGKLVIKGGDGTIVRGRWRAHDGSVTIRSEHGQEKTLCLHGSTPQGLARLMLLDMHPVPPTPKEIEDGEKNIKRAIAESRFDRMADYGIRGRRFRGLSDAALHKAWTAAHDKLEAMADIEGAKSNTPMRDALALELAERLATDLDAEFEIRGIESPYPEYVQRRWAKNQQKQARKE